MSILAVSLLLFLLMKFIIKSTSFSSSSCQCSVSILLIDIFRILIFAGVNIGLGITANFVLLCWSTGIFSAHMCRASDGQLLSNRFIDLD